MKTVHMLETESSLKGTLSLTID